MPSREKLSEFTVWCRQHITDDEKVPAQIFLGHLFGRSALRITWPALASRETAAARDSTAASVNNSGLISSYHGGLLPTEIIGA